LSIETLCLGYSIYTGIKNWIGLHPRRATLSPTISPRRIFVLENAERFRVYRDAWGICITSESWLRRYAIRIRRLERTLL